MACPASSTTCARLFPSRHTWSCRPDRQDDPTSRLPSARSRHGISRTALMSYGSTLVPGLKVGSTVLQGALVRRPDSVGDWIAGIIPGFRLRRAIRAIADANDFRRRSVSVQGYEAV